MWPNTCSPDQFFSVDLDSFSKYLFIEHWPCSRPCSGQRGCTVNSSYKPLSGGLHTAAGWLQESRPRATVPPHPLTVSLRDEVFFLLTGRVAPWEVMPVRLSNATFLNPNQSLLGNSRYSRAFPKENKIVFQKFKGLKSVIRIHISNRELIFIIKMGHMF